MSELNPAQKTKVKFWVTIVVLFAVGLGVSPFIMKAIHGLLGLGASVLICGVMYYASYPIGSLFQTMRIKAIKAIARRNPVENLEKEHIRNQQKLTQKYEQIKNFIVALKNYESQLSKLKKTFPEETAQFEEYHDKMEQLLQLKEQKYKDAEVMVAREQIEIDKAQAIWEIGQAGDALQESSGVMTEEDFFDQLAKKTAYAAIQDKVNHAFAELDMALLTEVKKPSSISDRVPQQINDRKPLDYVVEASAPQMSYVPRKTE